MSMDYKKVQFSGYKSFHRNDKNILDAIGKVNVIIGKIIAENPVCWI